MATIPEDYRDLFEKPSFAFVATLLPDGAPHVVPTWVDFDGDSVLVNTVRGSRKDRNLRSDPRIALAIADPENPYRYLSVRGEAVDIREEGAREQLDEMAERYTGKAEYPGPGGDRVVITVRPNDVSGQSPPPRRP
jgi:PPOX class probable F420-dependent enzyme